MKKKVVAVVAAVAVVVIVAALIISMSLQPSEPTNPKFKILEEHGDPDWTFDENLNVLVTYTVYVKVNNEGATGTQTVYCKITREDLTTMTKNQALTLEAGETKILEFVFDNTELKGAPPSSHNVWIG